MRISKVFVQVVVDFNILFCQFGVQYLCYQWDVVVVVGFGFGFCFQCCYGMVVFIDSGDQIVFSYIEVGVDLCVVWQFIYVDSGFIIVCV